MNTKRVDRSADGSRKHLMELDDGFSVEAVWIPQSPGVNLCISCQVGCPNKCRHCATGTVNYERDLTEEEILFEVSHLLDQHGTADGNVRVLFMGMGEPMLNFDSVFPAIRTLVARRVVQHYADVIVSTSGVVPGIRRLMREPTRPRLAVTIGAVPDDKRTRLIPTAKFYPLSELLAACREYQAVTGDGIIFEIPLIQSFNSAENDAREVAQFLQGFRCEIQVVPFNKFETTALLEPTDEEISHFSTVLRECGLAVFVKRSYGRDIRAGCGQLAITRP